MAEKLGLGNEIRELKIGQSFINPNSKAFHTVRYDFKPASVDTSKKATLDVGDSKQVTVTVPHLDGAGTTQTVFKGSQRPYTKECVLIIDRNTGEITLERLSCNIQVKKTRSEFTKTPLPQERSSSERGGNSSLTQRSATPPASNVVAHRVSTKTRVASGSRRPDRQITQLMPKHSPLRASPGHPSPNAGLSNQRSPGRSRDLHTTVNETHNPSLLASLPMIGMDDFNDTVMQPEMPNSSSHHNNRLSAPPVRRTVGNAKPSSPLYSDNENGVGTITDSSSTSSDSDSEEESVPDNTGVHVDSNLATLNEDLCLSESGSDSD